MIQEYQTEEKNTYHHRKRGHVIGVSRMDKTLILCMFERSDRDLLNIIQVSVSDTTIIHQELENPIDVRQLECGTKYSV